MLGAKHGFGQSTDVTAQSVDPCFARTNPGMFHVQRTPTERANCLALARVASGV